MKAVVNTEALKAGLGTLILDSGISKFNPKSCITRLTISKGTLQLDTEYTDIKSRLRIDCETEGSSESVIYIESSVFKKLINSLTAATLTLTLDDSDSTSLIVNAGKSKFIVPQIAEYMDVKFGIDTANSEDLETLFDGSAKFDFSAWKFISNYQLYAIADNTTNHKAYTNVYVGENNEIIVGDYNNNLFTFSTKNTMFDSCMLSGSVVKLLISYPDDSCIARSESQSNLWYIMCHKDDGHYSLISEFTTKLESESENYQADKVIPLMTHDDSLAVTIPNLAAIRDVLAQGSVLVSNKNGYVINLAVSDGKLRIYGNNMEYVEDIDNSNISFEVAFRLQKFIDTVSHLDSNEVKIMPKYRKGRDGGEVVIAILIWTDDLTIVLGA